jgi:hypothetical protein
MPASIPCLRRLLVKVVHHHKPIQIFSGVFRTFLFSQQQLIKSMTLLALS